MMNRIEKKIYADGEPYYYDTGTTEKYGEFVGGLAWPETKEGFLVIPGIDLPEDTESETRHIRGLTGVKESNIKIFLKYALELQKQFSSYMGTIRFYGVSISSP
jgi:hypothetical protein